MATTYAPTTELEAVNIMLATIGEAPINSLSSSGLGDVSAAKTRLHNTSRAVQMAGWHFNSEENYELSPTVDGFLQLPLNALKVDTTKEFTSKDVTTRGFRLYNRTDHTYIFDAPLKVDMVLFLAFEELPEAARNYITIKAARAFQSYVLGSELIEAFTQDDEMEALVEMKSAETENGDYNMLTASFSVSSILRR
jgi:hypothetical protein